MSKTIHVDRLLILRPHLDTYYSYYTNIVVWDAGFQADRICGRACVAAERREWAPAGTEASQELGIMKIYSLIIALLISLPGSARSAPAAPNMQTAVFAGGCYWGTEAVFEHVKGVKRVVSGYAGGSSRDANYQAVNTETTRHAESVKITYDPSQISYSDLLRIFFATHDPTEVDRQGPDIGSSYRSAIFPQNSEQAKQARDFIDQINAAHLYDKPVATRIETGDFYPAESFMQHYFEQNPSDPYIIANDKPKLKLLRQKFPEFYKDRAS
jgi:peptide-methionine (S)-S-oxide reductase